MQTLQLQTLCNFGSKHGKRLPIELAANMVKGYPSKQQGRALLYQSVLARTVL